MSTILITGAAGLIGSYVTMALQVLGFQIRAQYSRAPGAVEGIDWRQMNFLESLDFDALVQGCDAVVHLAGELSDVAQMPRINIEATLALLAAAQAAGSRYFGYASSIVVYGSPRQRLVDETTPLIDPGAPMARQYHAEPYMLEYARTKALAELAIRDFRPQIDVDLYRPAVVANADRLLEAGNWSPVRRFGAAYRRTQYIYAPDAAAAIAHLAAQGLSSSRERPAVEAFNICDEGCGTFRDLLSAAYDATGDPRYKARADFPVVPDLLRDMVKYRQASFRYPLGMLKFSSAKLRATGFEMPTGIKAALLQALAQKQLAART